MGTPPPTESPAEAFLSVYHQHRSPVFRFAYRLTGSEAAAEDITQDCFLAMIRGAAFDHRRAELRTYLFGIVRNLVFRRYRINEREAEEATLAPAPIDLLGDLLRTEQSDLVAAAMAQLPVLQREAIILFTFEELSLEEIANVTGVSTGTVKSRLHRARESLRLALTPLLARDAERKCS